MSVWNITTVLIIFQVKLCSFIYGVEYLKCAVEILINPFFFKQRSSRISQKILRPVTGRPFLRLKNPGASGGQPLRGGNSWRKLET